MHILFTRLKIYFTCVDNVLNWSSKGHQKFLSSSKGLETSPQRMLKGTSIGPQNIQRKSGCIQRFSRSNFLGFVSNQYKIPNNCCK